MFHPGPPCQASASVSPSPEPPTAVQELGPEQDTALSQVGMAPVGSGVTDCVQVVPFQAAARVVVPPDARNTTPAAVQLVADGQDTPFSCGVSPVPAVTGMFSATQPLGVDRSAAFRRLPDAS